MILRIIIDMGTGNSAHENPTRKASSSGMQCVPFLKWAGGKRWLAKNYLGIFPTTYDRYIEPFLGGGSVFFALGPSKAILADSNSRLIETYEQIRENPQYLGELLRRHQAAHSDDYYYIERERRHPRSAAQRAAQLIYLNRTCWNGLYRVNLKGQFNVPRGSKSSVLLESDDFVAVSTALKRAELVAQDFEATIAEARVGDFVYVDPPYTVNHTHNGFAKYNERIFSWDDQVRLRDAIVAAVGRGASVAVSNASHSSVRELYRGVGSQTVISRRSVIAADSGFRGRVDQLLVLSWDNRPEQ